MSMLPLPLRVLYLHGFASSPASRKALFFSQKLRALDIPFEAPDLAQGNFEQLTITSQLRVLEDYAQGDPLLLIGSSLGGYLAALFAAAHPEIVKLVLLAPAFHFHQLWIDQLGPEKLAAWRKNGAMPILHYGEARKMQIGYQIMEDPAQYPPFPDFSQPALLFHGTQDPVVPVQYSLAFAETRRNVALVTLPSGHELTDVMDLVWEQTLPFLLDKAGI